jgi:hypothetical protein
LPGSFRRIGVSIPELGAFVKELAAAKLDEIHKIDYNNGVMPQEGARRFNWEETSFSQALTVERVLFF